jgi:Flp pilus assembly protein TadD
MINGLFNLKNVAMLVIGFGVLPACAQKTITIKIPRHSSLTVVQRLNREGVAAIEKRDYDKAAGFFYKAYLYDPADPFTLNNLGYIAELQGQLDRAERFYKLAAEQGCNADIDLSNVKRLEGQPMRAALSGIQNTPMRIDRINVEAVQLLSNDQGAEAVDLLQQALSLNPNDPFTLNNLGAANEAIGNDSTAMKDYIAAAGTHSQETAVIAEDPSWRGKPVREVAAANASRLQRQIAGTGSAETKSFELSLHGVLAENENNWPAARRDLMEAYSTDPTNAFSLNNRGYVAERDGDLESAQFFYGKAWQAAGANLRVGLATNGSQQGKPLSQVADSSNQKVDGALEVYSQERHRETGPIVLTPRGNGATGDSSTTPQQLSSPAAAPALPPASKPQIHQ